MYLDVYSPDFERVAVIEVINSLSWTTRMQAPGEISMEVPFTPATNAALAIGNFLLQKGGTEAMFISYRELSTNDEGYDVIRIQGSTVLQALAQRVALEGQNYSTVTPLQVVRWVIEDNATDPDNTYRKFPHLALSSEEMTQETIEAYEISAGTDILSIVTDVMSQYDMGCRCITDISNETHTMRFFQPVNHTSNSDHPCIFSVEYDTLGAQNFIESLDTYKSVVLTHRDDGYETWIGEETGAGFNRFETYITVASDISMAGMGALARTELGNCLPEMTFSGDIAEHHSPLVYRVDYRVGDRVTCRYTRWGVEMDETLTEITETWSQDNSYKIEGVFGRGTPTLSQRFNAAISIRRR